MSGQIIFIGTYGIPEGRFEEFKTANREMTEFVRANEPRVISFNTYVNEDGTEGTTIQVHPDSESLEYHLQVAASRIQKGVQMVESRRIELYGKPSDHLLEQLRRASEMSGRWPVVVKTHLQGFSGATEERSGR
ncbi:MAG: hypothetical protein HYX86_01160 [Chloroflexi bacterium]|nr:hypothetical protein [Chloroflexota bacterium]